MLVQQAVFTSVRTGRNDGYQIAASSKGISGDQLRQLAQWGPSHGSLYEDLPVPESVNYHRLSDGEHCVSRTLLAGREYSGRGGQKVYTHLFLLPDEVLTRFGTNPFRVIESLVVSGRCGVLKQLPMHFEPLHLVGRAAPVHIEHVQQVVEQIGALKLAGLVDAALRTEKLGVATLLPGKRLLQVLVDLLPPTIRASYTLTTGLQVCATRDFRLSILPPRAEEQRRARRQARMEVVDLDHDLPARFAPDSGWAQLIHGLLHAEDYETLADVIETAGRSTEADVNVLAEQLRERWEKMALQPCATPFSA